MIPNSITYTLYRGVVEGKSLTGEYHPLGTCYFVRPDGSEQSEVVKSGFETILAAFQFLDVEINHELPRQTLAPTGIVPHWKKRKPYSISGTAEVLHD